MWTTPLSTALRPPRFLHRLTAMYSTSPSSDPPGNDNQPLRWHYGDADLDDKNFQIHGRSMLLVIVVFSLLLFLTLLCLYARWACRYRRMVITVSGSSAMGLDGMESSGGVYTVTMGLDKDVIDRMPVILFQESDKEAGRKEEEVRCSICLNTFREGDKVKALLECGHMFHPECVDEWLRAQATCPLCRATLGVGGAEGLGNGDEDHADSEPIGEAAV